MKEFFEEYGRVIVTVLIILGIILVGYVIAGNGKTSAFGRFTSNIVDTLTRQDSSLIKGDSAYMERVAENKHTPATSFSYDGTAKISREEKNGISCYTVTGKSEPTWEGTDHATVATDDKTPVPWGKKSVMSFDLFSDRDCKVWINLNAYVDGVPGDDAYSANTSDCGLFLDGVKSSDRVKVSGNSWHHFTVILENGNEEMNPQHKPFREMANSIWFGQDRGTTKYQVKNLKYGIAD